MKPFEQRRARIEACKLQKQKENSLKISVEASEKSDIVSFEGKGKEKEKEKGKEKGKEKEILLLLYPLPLQKQEKKQK